MKLTENKKILHKTILIKIKNNILQASKLIRQTNLKNLNIIDNIVNL